MTQAVQYFIGLFPRFLQWASGLQFAPGVSFLGVCFALLLIYMFLNNFLFRAR